MKVLVLGIDINRSSCDPDLYFDRDNIENRKLRYLDETAERIADFMADVRDDLSDDHVAWTVQNFETSADHAPKPYSVEERAFHHVTVEEGDTVLPKTQMSPYPEHEAFFEGLKDDGVDTVVLTGFYASKCVYWTLHGLLENDFKVIVPTDLIADSNNNHTMSAFDDVMHDVYYGDLVFTESDRVADMLHAAPEQRSPPVPTITWDDLNAMHYGPGS